jgi:hypothetical protein
LTWTPSLDPQVTGYMLFKDSKLIATIPAGYGPFVYDDPIQCKSNKKITYTLYAFNAQGETSLPKVIKLH